MSKKKFDSKKIREEVGAVRQAENNMDEEMFHRDEKPSKRKTRNCNDPAWYAQNETLLKDSASFAFANFTGASYALDPSNIYSKRLGSQAISFASLTKRAVPGFMSIKLAPTVGVSKNNLSAVNIAARNLYTFVRHQNSGHTNYDSPNLMMYILAANSAYSYYSWLMRTYGIAMYYSVFNRYLPKTLVEGIGIDYEDLIANLANYRFRMNRAASKLATFCVPATMSYTARTIWIYSRIFADSPNPKAQLYLYNPEYFWRYDESSNTLVAVGLDGDFDSVQTFGKHLSNLESMINAISESEDFNIMSGDILKAFGADKLVKLPLLDDSYQIAPVFDREVLDQIQNTTFMGRVSNVNIAENYDTGALMFDPVFTTPRGTIGYQLNKMYTTAMDRTDPASVMVGSRLSNIASDEEVGAHSTAVRLDYAGSEVATRFRITQNMYNSMNDTWGATYIEGYSNMAVLDTPDADNPRTVADIMHMQEALSAFDYHPLVNFWQVHGTGSAIKYYGFGTSLDVDWYAVLNITDLQKMHDTAIISEFNVPAMGAYSQV